MKKVLLLCLFGLGMMVQSAGCGWLFGCCSGKSDVSTDVSPEIILEHYQCQQQIINYYHEQQQELINAMQNHTIAIDQLSADLRDQRNAIVYFLREMRDLKK
jgi:hypothetical protein